MKKLTVSVLLIIGPALFFGYLGKPVEMGIGLFAGFACAVLLNLEKFNSFKAGELEATIRHVEEVINDANATIDQLKSMTEPLMRYQLTHIAKGDTLVGVSSEDKEYLYLKLKENIENFGLKDKFDPTLIDSVKQRIIHTSLVEIYAASGETPFTTEESRSVRDLIYTDTAVERRNPEVHELRKLLSNPVFPSNDKIEEALKRYEVLLQKYGNSESK